MAVSRVFLRRIFLGKGMVLRDRTSLAQRGRVLQATWQLSWVMQVVDRRRSVSFCACLSINSLFVTPLAQFASISNTLCDVQRIRQALTPEWALFRGACCAEYRKLVVVLGAR